MFNQSLDPTSVVDFSQWDIIYLWAKNLVRKQKPSREHEAKSSENEGSRLNLPWQEQWPSEICGRLQTIQWWYLDFLKCIIERKILLSLKEYVSYSSFLLLSSLTDSKQSYAVFRFLISVNPSDIAELDATLGNYILHEPVKATKIFQTVRHLTFRANRNVLTNLSHSFLSK